MVCAVNTVAGDSQQVGLASTCPPKFTGRSRMEADMHGLIPRRPHSRNYEGQVETVPTSGNSFAPAYFQKRGMPFFPQLFS